MATPQGFMGNIGQEKPTPSEQKPIQAPPVETPKKRGCTFSIAISLCGIGIVAAFFLLTTQNESTPNNQTPSADEISAPSMAVADSAMAPAAPMEELIPEAGFASSKVDTATHTQAAPTIIAKATSPIPPKIPPAAAIKVTSKPDEHLVGSGHKAATSRPPDRILQTDTSTFLLSPIDTSIQIDR